MAQLAKIYPGCQSNVFYIGSALLLSLSGSCCKRYLLWEAMGDRGGGGGGGEKGGGGGVKRVGWVVSNTLPPRQGPKVYML